MNTFDFKNKKVLVMGLGLHGGGLESVRWLYKQGAKITVTDLKTKKELAPALKKLKRLRNINYHLGGHQKSDFLNCDLVLKGPGVPADSEYLKIALEHRIPVITDIHIFLGYVPENVKIIGVTGTKGKSTSATLIAKVLGQKYRTHLAGNIRKSVLEILPKIKSGDFVVLELSSFQLEDITDLKYRFPVAVLTSLFPDHLNRHGTFAAYRKAKEVIFKYQNKSDLLVANGDDKNARKSAWSARGRIIYVMQNEFAKNAARVIGKYFGVPRNKTEQTSANFKGLSGRLEEIHKLKGVIFINDTTATNPGAAVYGINAIHKKYPNKKLVIIAGGYDKKLAVEELAKILTKYASAIVFLPGEASDKIRAKLPRLFSSIPPLFERGGILPKRRINVVQAKNMPEAVRVAYQLAMSIMGPNGVIVLLSPGAASFGLFKHEFDRGDKFNEAVRRLK